MCPGACDDRRVRVAGMDIWKTRWVVAVVQDGRFERAHVADDARSAIASVPDVRVIGIDIPIGLPPLGLRRTADRQARKLVGRHLASSVFPAPAAELVEAPTFEAATAIAHRRGCPGVSRQTYALRTAILEVAPLAEVDRRIHEVHPEVSFRLARGCCLDAPKTSWVGMRERCATLQKHGLVIPDALPEARRAGVADVLDAVACAWTAGRIAEGDACRLPSASGARAPAIWG
jgi:predicted RNase H-like nuclease